MSWKQLFSKVIKRSLRQVTFNPHKQQNGFSTIYLIQQVDKVRGNKEMQETSLPGIY